MRKLLWYGLAALLAGVGGTGYYAYRYPHSVVGQCVSKAGEFGFQANPVILMTRTMAGFSIPREESLCCQMTEEDLPGEPTPVEEPTPAAETLAGLLDLNPIMRVPAPIVIREDEDAGPGQAGGLAGVPMADADNEVQSKGGQLPGGPAADSEQGNSCPRIMPYVTDEAESKRMPYAGESGPGGPFDPEVFNQGPRPLSSVATELMRAFLEGFADNKSANGGSEEAEPKDTPMESPGTENTYRNLPNYHHYHDSDRYMVCPYSGKCVEIKPPCDPESKCKEADSEYEPIPAPAMEEEESEPKCKTKEAECETIPDIFMEEESEPLPAPATHSAKVKMMLHKSFKHGECWPIHPEVDTMEFRPSDASHYHFKRGPY